MQHDKGTKQMSYQIIGTYQGTSEVIDTTDTYKQACKLVIEYRLAYGSDWKIGIKRVRNEGV